MQRHGSDILGRNSDLTNNGFLIFGSKALISASSEGRVGGSGFENYNLRRAPLTVPKGIVSIFGGAKGRWGEVPPPPRDSPTYLCLVLRQSQDRRSVGST